MSVVLSSRIDHSNKMNKNRYKSSQLIASKKENNLKIAEEQMHNFFTCSDNFHSGVEITKSANYLCKVPVLFVGEK